MADVSEQIEIVTPSQSNKKDNIDAQACDNFDEMIKQMAGEIEPAPAKEIKKDDNVIKSDIKIEEPKIEKPKPPVKAKHGRKPMKAQLIDQIEKFRDHVKVIIPGYHALKKMRNDQLERLLAQCVESSTGLKPQSQEDLSQPQQMPQVNGDNFYGMQLFSANYALVRALEVISQNTSDFSGIEIEGWSDELKRQRDQLLPLLQSVWKEHSASLSTYMSPTGIWAMTMMCGALSHTKMKPGIKKGLPAGFTESPHQS